MPLTRPFPTAIKPNGFHYVFLFHVPFSFAAPTLQLLSLGGKRGSRTVFVSSSSSPQKDNALNITVLPGCWRAEISCGYQLAPTSQRSAVDET
ncbi:hypothetical protein L209DRAFT_589665 [Thermothelomyces heterothallicus CBS 203.75]